MQKNSHSQLYSLIVVFFFWGFIAASNGIFIPFCKAHFQLSQFQSQLIDFTFYGGYFIGSVILFLLSQISKVEILNKIGYKKGIIFGLLISVVGALAIIPSVNAGSFPLILGAFFIVALGFSLQQTAANPFVIALGNPTTGAHRLNLAGGINSLGTTLGPIIVSYFLFGSLENADASKTSIESIKELYLIVAGIFALMALYFSFTNLPHVKSDETVEQGIPALKYPQLWMGMIAIFMYVGVEVTIQSNMGALLKLPEFGGYDEAHLSQFISLYWGSLMIGRWTGAVSALNLSDNAKKWLRLFMPLIAFAVVLAFTVIAGYNIQPLKWYFLCILVQIVAFYITNDKPAFTLMVFGILGTLATIIGMSTAGMTSIYAFLSAGLFLSIMWPCIFSLSVAGLGKYQSQGAGFLVMMILGGAILPPIQGKLADIIGIHNSFFIGTICFVYLTYYAIFVKKSLKSQGIEFDEKMSGAH